MHKTTSYFHKHQELVKKKVTKTDLLSLHFVLSNFYIFTIEQNIYFNESNNTKKL